VGVPERFPDQLPVYQKEAGYQYKKNNPKEQGQGFSAGTFFLTFLRPPSALSAAGFSYRHFIIIREIW
jgi:hypothetical protein